MRRDGIQHSVLVAPPGTRLDEPGWREPWPGLVLRWDINGGQPALAVQRDGVLICTGLPMPEITEAKMHPGCVEDRESGLFGNTASAVFNEARTHRFLLARTWDEAGPVMAWLMLNPSTADALTNDQTIARCIARAHQSYGGIAVVNLFALRSPDPAALRKHPDPVGAGNDQFITGACSGAETVVAAWGAHGKLLGRDREVTRMLAAAGVRLQCLGITSGGQPRHPLYIRGDAPLIPYEPGAVA